MTIYKDAKIQFKINQKMVGILHVQSCKSNSCENDIFHLINKHLILSELNGIQRVFLEANRDLTTPSSNIICPSICTG